MQHAPSLSPIKMGSDSTRPLEKWHVPNSGRIAYSSADFDFYSSRKWRLAQEVEISAFQADTHFISLAILKHHH
jgi:hypothetical protein